MDHEGAAKRPEQVERVARPAHGDELASRAERLDEDLDLAGSAIDPVERVRAAEERVEARTRTDVHELPRSRVGRDPRGGDEEDAAELPDLLSREDAAGLEDHVATPTANV